ncbi:platelet endothelial aggregation receptor 1, partial [Biomphalaria glabrata]
ICFLFQVNHIFAQCPDNWFGANCKHLCYCADSCNAAFDCSICNLVTFGYECQYFPLSYDAKTDITNNNITLTLSDGDNSTCISLTGEKIVIDFEDNVSVTWLRFETSKPDDLQYGFKITFQDDKSQSVNLSGNETLIVVDNTIDVHFQLNSTLIQYIILEGKVVQEMCTLVISMGQFASFMKTAYYSLPDMNITRTPNQELLDGYTYSNPITDGGKLWEIDLESSYIVQKVYIFFRHAVFSRAVIEVFDNDGVLIYTWRIESQHTNPLIFSSSVTTPVQYINVITEDARNASLTTIIEKFMAYGECPEGTWGVQCRENCSSECPDVCRFDDGLCNKYCLGYSDPPKCETECQTGWFGVNCKSQCNDRCWSCNSRTGVCDQGCLGYSDPPNCTIECETGLWGVNCTSQCSDRCFNTTCNSRTGKCVQGCLGYSDALNCTNECDTGTWGVNCSNQCSNRCFNQSCDSITGKCNQGCSGYSDTPDCTIECDTGLWGRNCASNCTNCFNSKCNSRSGLCDQGCLGYSDPPSCTTECGSGYWGLNCTYQSCDGKSESQSLSREATIAIAVSLSLFGLIVVVVVFVVLKNKGIACFGTTALVVPQN